MSVRVIVPPLPLVTLEDAKKHLLVDHNDDDDLINGFIMAASQWIDGPAGWLKQAIGVQTLELATDQFYCLTDWRGIIQLPFPPLIDIVSVVYTNSAGDDVTMPPEAYQQTIAGVRPLYSTWWPDVRIQSEGVRIRYRAGYGKQNDADPPAMVNDPPAPVRVAVLMLVAQWYRTREPVAIGATVETLPFAVEALLSPYRVYL